MDSNACGAGENGFCITPEGNVETCVAFPASFGNLKTQSFIEILNSPEMQWWLHLTLNDYEDCGKHDYCDYCNLCVGNNYVEHGTPLKAAELNCSMAKTRQSVAQRLMNGDDPLQGRPVRECLSALDNIAPNLRQAFTTDRKNYRGKRINGVSETTPITR